MALNVGQDFKKRWLTAPAAVRQTFQDDLARICDLLQPETAIETWEVQNRQAQQASFDKIEDAYATLKAELIEQARLRKQAALEQALTEKREQEASFAAALHADEVEKFKHQTQELVVLRNNLQQEVEQQTARYHQNPNQVIADYAYARQHVPDQQIQSQLESTRLRLELEADSCIEQAVTQFRAQLKKAAQEEIEYILKNTEHSR